MPPRDPPRYTILTNELLDTIQHGSVTYTYRDIETQKDPFDLALYMQLLWREKPQTIIEIGSKHGGSALWLRDMMRTFAVPCAIHTVDVAPPALRIEGVTIHRGDGRNLAATFDEGFLSRMARPLLVLEDADHMPETTYAVMRFFDPWLRPGEYIVVEDGLLVDQGLSEHYRGGPLVAIDRFLAERGSDYEIDRSYCDHYGRNVTWNVNGYIRKRAKPNVVVQSVTFKMIR